MKRLFRPTLARRVLLALVSAFFVVWVVLIAFQYAEVRIQEDSSPALKETAAQIADICQRSMNRPRPGLLLRLLAVASGTRGSVFMFRAQPLFRSGTAGTRVWCSPRCQTQVSVCRRCPDIRPARSITAGYTRSYGSIRLAGPS